MKFVKSKAIVNRPLHFSYDIRYLALYLRCLMVPSSEGLKGNVVKSTAVSATVMPVTVCLLCHCRKREGKHAGAKPGDLPSGRI